VTVSRGFAAIPLLSTALALALAGCASFGGSEGPQGSRALDRITRSGELRIGMTGEQPPLNMTSRSGELFGLEVALGRVLAGQMGVKARFVRLPFAQLLPAVESGEVDLVMSGMTITPRRNKRVAFVGPYYVSGKSLLTTSESVARVRQPSDLDQDSFRFAALAGSTSEDFVRNLLPNASLVTTPGLERGIAKVLAGEVDALVADRETCAVAVLRNPGRGLLATEVPLTVEPMGIALPPDDPLFANLLENYLDALEGTGMLEEATAYWFENPAWLKSLP
jgi:polar amino acid transport system substrate-binding protein